MRGGGGLWRAGCSLQTTNELEWNEKPTVDVVRMETDLYRHKDRQENAVLAYHE